MSRLVPLAVALAPAPATVVGDLSIIPTPISPQPAENAMAGGTTAIPHDGTEPDRLIGVESDIAAKSTLHEIRVDENGMGSMTPVEAIGIPPGGTINPEHDGENIMFIRLKAPLIKGQIVKGALILEDARRTWIEFMVDP